MHVGNAGGVQGHGGIPLALHTTTKLLHYTSPVKSQSLTALSTAQRSESCTSVTAPGRRDVPNGDVRPLFDIVCCCMNIMNLTFLDGLFSV